MRTQEESERVKSTHILLESASGGRNEDTEKKKNERVRATYSLERASKGTSEDTERKQTSEGHSLAGNRTGRVRT